MIKKRQTIFFMSFYFHNMMPSTHYTLLGLHNLMNGRSGSSVSRVFAHWPIGLCQLWFQPCHCLFVSLGKILDSQCHGLKSFINISCPYMYVVISIGMVPDMLISMGFLWAPKKPLWPNPQVFITHETPINKCCINPLSSLESSLL